jgi:hypothetical protein
MKIKKEIAAYILNLFKWLLFTFVAIYGAQRVVRFMHDPYGESVSYGSDMGVDVFITMSAQTIAYVIIFKKDYTWQTITTVSITFVLVVTIIIRTHLFY